MRHIFRKILIALAVVVVILNWTWGRLPAEPPAPAGAKYAEVDGVKIHYQETRGSGPGVIMIHGHPGTFLDWNYVRAKLPGMHTVAIDRPGYGYSSGGYIAFEDQVEAIHALAKKLGMERPVIAGHSYGGTLALAYAHRYPKATTGIVPVDPAVNTDDLNAMDMVQAQFVKALQVPIVKPVANATFNQLALTASSKPQVEQAFAPDPVNEDYDEQLRAVNLKSSDLETFADETLAFQADVAPSVAQFSTIRTPAWIVQGKDDKLVSAADVKQTASEMKRAKLIMLSGGHMQTWVHPQQVASAIRAAAR